MTTMTKQPTVQGISALLKRAYFARGVPKMRGGQSGYRVSQGDLAEVLVWHYSFIGGSVERERRHLDGYAQAIRDAGWDATLDTKWGSLAVTRPESDDVACGQADET